MASFVPLALFWILAVISVALGLAVGRSDPTLGGVIAGAGLIVSAVVASAIKIANQWERAIVLRLGQFRGIRGPGIFWIVPVIDRVRLIDTRVLAYHIREQEVITRDNVPVTLDSVLFYRVVNPEDAVLKI
jgi:regulator of protease activity HflC (stomatin/prohibitin superfamily)